MPRPATVTDSGLRAPLENLALDRAQWYAALLRTQPAQLRFHRYPPTVSLGAHQSLGLAVRREFCRARGIAIVRRLTGGGALYLDPDQIAWTLTLPRTRLQPDSLSAWMERLCTGLVAGLRRLGVAARFVPPNDVEVAGRKCASGFVLVHERALLFQGTLLLDADVETRLKALRMPTEKLSPEGLLSARTRLVTLRELGVAAEPAALHAALAAGWKEVLECHFEPQPPPADTGLYFLRPLPGPPDDWEGLAAHWQQAFVKTPGGVLHAALSLSTDGERLRQVMFAADVQFAPRQWLASLAERLRDIPAAELERRCTEFFARTPADTLGFTPDDVLRVLRLALARRVEQVRFGLSCAQANTLMVHDAGRGLTAGEILAYAGAVLVPYCAKPTWCKWRHRNGCPECGRCEVGEAYRLARARGLRVITVTDFEHLQRTLAALRAQKVAAYVGICCRHFYLKREYAFRKAGLPALLMDISGANCYELQQEELAYAGKFQAQARLNLDVVRRVLGDAGSRCAAHRPGNAKG